MKSEIWNQSWWIDEVNPGVLEPMCQRRLLASGFGVMGFIEHHFEPQGWTGLWLLAESHLAVHTFPEENRTYIELSSCNENSYNQFKAKMEL